MGYTATGKLATFGRVEPMQRAARRTTDRVGQQLKDRVVEHTPVAKSPPGAEREWLAARKRAPGHLRDSWKVGKRTVIVFGERFSIDVYTRDPIAPYVEWPTMPHLIIPRRPGGWLRFWNQHGGIVFARLVHHPGTKGSYMMTTALAEVAVQWQDIGDEEMAVWAREQAALVAA